MHKRIVLLGLVTILALVVGFITFPPNQAIVVVRKVGYGVMLLEAALFAFFLWRSLRDIPWRTVCRRDARWGLVVLAGALFLQINEPHGIKIMADEAVLNCTAMQMHFERDAAVMMRGYDVGGDFTPTVVMLDKRPLFFPFLVSLVHDLTGYRFENVYWLNGLLSVALLGLLFVVARKLAGNLAGVVAVILMCSVPLVSQNVTGAGFELLNMVMILATVWLGMRLVERPESDRLSVFVLSGVLLAQVRYESVLFVLPVAAAIIYVWIREKRLTLPPVLIAAPLLLVLFPLQYSVFKVSTASWQLSDIPGATSPFGFRYFYDNVGHDLSFFLNADGTQPSSWLVGLVGILGIGFYVLWFYREHRSIFTTRPVEALWAIFFMGLCVHTALMLFYFWGHWDDPIIRRLSLPFHLLLILSAVAMLPRLIPGRRRWETAVAVAGAYLFLFTIPALAMHRYTTESVAGEVATWVHDFARRQAGRKVLALDVNDGFIWFLDRQASITAASMINRIEPFLYHYKLGTFDDIYVVQRVTSDLKTGLKWVAYDDDVGPAVKLETVTERQFNVGYVVRIARVKELDADKLRAWAAEQKADEKKAESERSGTHLSRPNGISDWFKSLP